MILSDEEAKAIQEGAKTLGKIIDASQSGAAYLARIIGTIPEDAVRLSIGDRLKHRRLRNEMRLAVETLEFSKRLGFEHNPKEVPFSYVYKIVEEASLEDSDFIKIWASLLASAANPNNNNQPDPSFISTVRDMSPLDAKVMNVLYGKFFFSGPGEPYQGGDIIGNFSRRRVEKGRAAYNNHVDVLFADCSSDYDSIRVCFDKLVRLGCLVLNFTSDPDTIRIDPNHYGVSLFHAINVELSEKGSKKALAPYQIIVDKRNAHKVSRNNPKVANRMA